MLLPFDSIYLPSTLPNKSKTRAKSALPATSITNLNPLPPTFYRSLSVHIDRINISNHVLNLRSSHKAVCVIDDEVVDAVTKAKRKITFNTNNHLSGASCRKLQKAVKYLNFINTTKRFTNQATRKDSIFKLAFVTLTLSSKQVHSDQVLKNKLINQFIIEAKKKWKVVNYVWRLEKQHNHNAHFHFLFDNFIPHAELCEVWNRIQEKLGYVEGYRKKMQSLSYLEYCALFKDNKKYTASSIKAAWIKGRATNWAHPNSTDVHSLLFIRDIDAYLIKYLQKSEQNQGVKGRMWGCSQSLSLIKGGIADVDSYLSEEVERIAKAKGVRCFSQKYFCIYFCDYKLLKELKCIGLLTLLSEFLYTNFKFKPNTS